MAVEVYFGPEATYRGVLFGAATVTLMLTADARIHEILQISADHFVKPVRVYVVKNPDGTPKYDPITKKVVTDVIVEQRLLPKGRKRDDLRLQYDVSAARVHLHEITRLLKAAHGGQIPTVSYDPQHPKAEHLWCRAVSVSVERAAPLNTGYQQPDPSGVTRRGAGRSVWRANQRDQPPATSCGRNRAATAVRSAAGNPG
jgi:hypothetical protein